MADSETAPQENQDRRVVDALYRVNNFLARINDLHELLEAIMEESKAVVDADASSCLLFDEEKQELYFEVALGDKADGVKEIRLPLGTGIGGECARDRKTLVINDVSQDARHYKDADEKSQYQTRNLIATPMVRNDKLIGVLEVLNKKDDRVFSPEDIRIIEFFAGQAAIAIENALLIRENVRSERLAAIGQTVASISHYVKNILFAIKGASSLVDQAIETDRMQMIPEVWPVVKKNNLKITSLVQDMLTYSKEREPELAPGNLNEVLSDTVEMCERSASDAGVDVVCEPDAAMPKTAFDVSRIGDAILNLANNAIDALAGRDGARVTLRSEYLPDKGLMRAIVSDNGPGIPKDIQSGIWEPFFSTKGSKGTGLGLAVARKVVKEHGGSIDLVSSEGQGATFTITLPARPPESAHLGGAGI